MYPLSPIFIGSTTPTHTTPLDGTSVVGGETVPLPPNYSDGKVFVDLGLWRSFPQHMKIAGETVHQVTTKEDWVAPGLGAAGLSNDMNNFVLLRERPKAIEKSTTIVRHLSEWPL